MMDSKEVYQVTNGEMLIMLGINGAFQTPVNGFYSKNRHTHEQATRLLREANIRWFGDSWVIKKVK